MSGHVLKEQTNLAAHLGVVRHFGIMDERAAGFRARRHDARRHVLQALDDRRLARSVRADNDRQRREEGDHLRVLISIAKAANALDGHLM